MKIDTTRQAQILAAITLLLVSQSWIIADDKQSGSTVPFATANVLFEQNATDGDVEVVFKIEGGDAGLVKLSVVSPDGRTVFSFSAPDASTLGIRSFRFESPEPGDAESLKEAYPEGVYIFSGTSAAGDRLRGKSTLNHKLPATTSFILPGSRGQAVSAKGLRITWTAVKNLAAYIIEIEQDELDVSITARLSGTATSFTVPDGFLLSGTQYDLAIGTVTEEGNISFVETSFTTDEVK